VALVDEKRTTGEQMSELSKDTVQRIHSLLSANALADRSKLTTIPLAQAGAVAGDIELLRTVFDLAGPEAFVGVSAKGYRVDAFEFAAQANQVDAMQWLCASGAIVKPKYRISGGASGDKKEISFDAAALAAGAGSFDALVVIAGMVPELKDHQMWAGVDGVFVVNRQLNLVAEKVTVGRVGFLGLLTGALCIARMRGDDVARMEERLRNYVSAGVLPTEEDVRLAVRLGEVDAFAAMIATVGRISIAQFCSGLGESPRVISILAALNDHIERNEASFAQLFYDEESTRQPANYREFARKPQTYAKISEVLTALGHVAASLTAYAGGPYARNVECDEERFAEQVMRFFSLVIPDGISHDMLARAASANNLPLARRLLEEGVDPNSRPFWSENASVTGRAAIHRAVSPQMVRLLHAFGADVTMPVRHAMTGGGKEFDGNLFTLMCSERADDPDMIFAFVECGGDLNQKFGGRTVSQLSAHKPERFKDAIRSVKSGEVIGSAVSSDAAPARSSRSNGPSAL
jgi:hypothetical protein